MENFETRDFRISRLKIFPYIRGSIPLIALEGEDGFLRLSPGRKGREMKIPSFIGKIDLERLKLELSFGKFSFQSPYTFIHYEGGSVVVGANRGILNVENRKISGNYRVRLSMDGQVREFSFSTPDLNVTGYSKGEFILFSFSLNPRMISPLLSGEISGSGTYRQGLLHLSAKGKDIHFYRGMLKELRIDLIKGRKTRGRIETSEGDLIFLRENKLNIARLYSLTLENLTGFPHVGSFYLKGEASYSSGTLSFSLQKNGGKISGEIGKNKIFISGMNLDVEGSTLNFLFQQTGKKGDVQIRVASRKLERTFITGRKIYKYFLGRELFLPEVSGSGSVEFAYNFEGKEYNGEGDFKLKEGKFYGYDIHNLEGSWKDSPKILNLKGKYAWERGEGEFAGYSSGGEGEIQYTASGHIEDVLKAVESEFDLKGPFQTKGVLKFKGENVFVKGSGSLINGMVLSMFKVSRANGDYTWDGNKFEISFYGDSYGGVLKGKLWSTPENAHLSTDVEGFKINKIIPETQGKGFLHVISDTEGEFTTTTFSGRIEKFGYLEEEKGKLDFTGILKGEKESYLFIHGELSGKSHCQINLRGQGEETIEGKISGGCDSAGNLLPWPGSTIQIRAKGNFSLEKELHYTINLDATGNTLTLIDYPQPVENFRMKATLKDFDLTIEEFKGKMGGGDIYGDGTISFTRPLRISMAMFFKDCQLYPYRGVEGKGSGEITVENVRNGIKIGGEINLKEGIWKREFEETLQFSSRPSGPLPSWLSLLTINVAVNSEKGVLVENSWGKFEVFPDFRLVGPVTEPGLQGEAVLGKGYMWVGERRFTIKRGKVYLPRAVEFDPYLDIEAETIIKNYRVEMKIQGLLSHVHISLSSSPPLPTYELFSLLAMGESFRRGISRTLSYQLGTSSLLSQQLTQKLGKRAKSFLGLSRLSISPYVLPGSTEPLARLTAEKQVGKNLTVVYSTNLASAKQEIIIIEYRVNPNISMILMRDEKGNVIFDIKYYPSFQ